MKTPSLSWVAAALLILTVGNAAMATDISDTPLITSPEVQAKPNLMFVMDDSGSMAWEYMPDVMSNSGRYGYRARQCNGLAYDPSTAYHPPLKADGTPYADASFTSARPDGLLGTGTAVNLGAATVTTTNTQRGSSSSSNVALSTEGDKTFTLTNNSLNANTFTVGESIEAYSNSSNSMVGTVSSWERISGNNWRLVLNDIASVTGNGSRTSWNFYTASVTGNHHYYNYSGSQPAMGWTYNNSGSVITSTDFYKECMSDVGDTPGSNVFGSPVYIRNQSAEQQKNYANWYSYYRTRSLLMRTAVGRAFGTLNEDYRIGFSTINSSTTAATSNGFHPIGTFNSAQKTSVFDKLYSSPTNGGTPLRGALSKIGRYYANKAPGQTADPVQYACQRNFVLLTTDGYWNRGGDGVEGSSYGPLDLFGNEVGNQDGDEARPMRDNTVGSTLYSRTRYVVPTTSGGSGCADTTETTTRTSGDTETVQRNVSRTFTITNAGNTSTTFQLGTSATARQTSNTSRYMTGTVTSWTQSSGSTWNLTIAVGTNTSSTSNTGRTGWTITQDVVTAYRYRVGTRDETSTDNQSWTAGNSSNVCRAGTDTINGQTIASLTGQTVYSEVTTSTITSGGSSNTLADVAQYYYKTDLRTVALGNCISSASGTAQNVCSDLVPTSDRDIAEHQHMTTFTIGLGLSGTLPYDPNYLTQVAGSYVDLVNGTANWPTPTTNLSGSSGDARNIDDLWHAAVNGRGQYYSALNATQLAAAIKGVSEQVQATPGSSSAATTNTLELVVGNDNRVYGASYTTGIWTGDLKAYTLDGKTGTMGSDPVWSAQTKLTDMAYASRKIYYNQANTLKAFTWANLNADGLGSHFSNLCDKAGVTQCASALNATEKTVANDGQRLVNFLSGDRNFEKANAAQSTTRAVYRVRAGVLGDIINGAPKYVGKPDFDYSDTGYASFASTKANRKPVVYVAANDGMLHAISAAGDDGGTELWAYVPTPVIPNLYRLADSDYANKHRYFVDGAPAVGDVYINGGWKTILVGGLGNGGRGYYALDITDPAAPKALWEFTSADNANLGLTFGNPVITKRPDGTWVVAFASGYNNTGPGDGKGHLFVLDAATGTVIHDIETPTASSGLAKISGWIDKETDNTSLRFYGGDELGNLWRFDTEGLVEPKNSALLLAKFQTNAATPQPVTTRPRLTLYANKPLIVVGTGRYLGSVDISDTTTQSIYVIKDSLTDLSLGDVRANNTLVRQTITATETSAEVTNIPVDWNANNGWWTDLPHSGERVVTDIISQSGLLTVATAIPGGDACTSGGSSWNYYLNLSNGGSIANLAGEEISDEALIVGQSLVKLTDGTLRIVRQLSDGSKPEIIKPPIGASSTITPQRTTWRELVD